MKEKMSNELSSISNQDLINLYTTVYQTAILQIKYDETDKKHHKHLQSLIHQLEESGYNTMANELSKEAEYVMIDSPNSALKIHHFINNHSAAIHSDLYYRGNKNELAENTIQRDKPKEKIRRFSFLSAPAFI